jgi:hypothetical protein
MKNKEQLDAIKKATAILKKARKDIERAEGLLAPYEGLCDELGQADRAIADTFDVMQDAIDELEDEDEE